MAADGSATAAARPPLLYRAHLLRHRARLRAADGIDRDVLIGLADKLAGVPNVRRALVRPSTRSVILETFDEAEAVLETIVAEGIARIKAAPKPPPVDQVIKLGLMRADMGVKARTGDALDFRTAIALALLFGSVVQLTRGRFAGPATTLAMSALTLLDRGK